MIENDMAKYSRNSKIQYYVIANDEKNLKSLP